MPSFSSFASSLKRLSKSRSVYNSSDIKSAYISMSLKKSFMSKKRKTTCVGKYQLPHAVVNYNSFNSFYFLFEEIFVGQEYYFTTENTSPYIIDCGSNIGMSILFYKYIYPDAEIIGFEPDDHAYAALSANVEENRLSKTTVFKKALMDKDGTIEFFFDPENVSALHMSVMKERESKSKIEVECTTLDKYITRDVDFLKLDIEGAELLVMQNLHQTGKLSSIKQMVIEYHHHIKKDEDTLSTMLHILETNNFGYQISARTDIPYRRSVMQDVIIYAYQK